MPSEPRVPTEPTLEELSAFIDNELDAAAQARVAEHVAGCQDCEARLDGLRQTAHAIRGLPMETPPRTFTIPAALPRRSRNWVPVGWIGGVAAAMVLVIVGVSHLHFPASTTASTTSAGSAYQQQQPAAAPVQGLSRSNDQGSSAFKAAPSANSRTVADPRNANRRLTVMTDHGSYSANGSMVVTGHLEGDASAAITQVRLVLRRGSYGVQLSQPAQWSFSGPQPNGGVLTFQGTYSLPSLPLTDPRAGNYTLTVTWTAADGSTLIDELPMTIS